MSRNKRRNIGDGRHVINERAGMLNMLLTGYITYRKDAEVQFLQWAKEQVADPIRFMDYTRLALSVTHPELMDQLVSFGLTVEEINYLCLYAIGLKGSEIGPYIKQSGHYNISSEIRKKLGLNKHSTNLGNYVRNLMKNPD